MSSDKIKNFSGNENVNPAGPFASLPTVDLSPTTPVVPVPKSLSSSPMRWLGLQPLETAVTQFKRIRTERRMSFLLFPGRHLVNTVFQEQYLKRVLTEPPASLPGFIAGSATVAKPPTEIIFAITSPNQENSRFNPIPFHIRAVGVDRFARQLQKHAPFRYRVLGIPHYGHTHNFAAFTVKEIAYQSEQTIQLTPENCIVLCSTPEVIRLYQELGFAIVSAELSAPDSHPATPIEIIREIGGQKQTWRAGKLASSQLAASHASLFDDFPEVPHAHCAAVSGPADQSGRQPDHDPELQQLCARHE